MKVLVIGGTGTIGQAVVRELGDDNEVVVAGRNGGDLRVDITSPDSIRDLLQQVGTVDAIVSCAGQAAFAATTELTEEQMELSVRSKLLGQVNLVRFGAAHVVDGGSITLSSGLLAHQPARGSAAISMVNAGVEAFARAAALDLPRGIRVNVVSPPWVAETLTAMGRDPSKGLPADKVALAYAECVRGSRTGEVLDARDFANG
ncbi:NAD(P)-dependent dehydrogenase (short-subunit alcohol dehydrogenase family) [Longimicrobium terrae]|uniref:NAD(P)-dependent dehydrogenase (Short-subunit alcohol dehydrogenase family) n=2 Tax=Longimicrobium terrae TaxID=1639882 RepID=A0A841GWC5_9BACT|nr:short chain dehydrogenase [Longimicrobium terrae]MBB4635680.1 NAD(P)-dependent dehydrogenase (short-subunit alcohol dehydrogenase family) [Longimicrobium terrae]MBB6070074.1 NAD(P)-dependent dehydrogenase (short-subunit alcohol dehydrogenase family) [Longimicrobium terrae]NNC32978.1 short chain dehydrogenase [Longimicrobium terrae]